MNNASFDRFDICAAYNVYAHNYGHDTYTNAIQARLARLAFKPSRSEETFEGLSENAQEIYLALVQREQGDEAFEAARREYRPELGDVVVQLENSSDDPFQIIVTVSDENAEKWADMDQTIEGSSWEGTGDPGMVYTILTWYPGIFESLKEAGYRLDFSQYSEPSEEEIEIAKHAMDCPSCEYDFRRAEKHCSSAE